MSLSSPFMYCQRSNAYISLTAMQHHDPDEW